MNKKRFTGSVLHSTIALAIVLFAIAPARVYAVDKTRTASLSLAYKKTASELSALSTAGNENVKVLSLAFYPPTPCLSDATKSCLNTAITAPLPGLPEHDTTLEMTDAAILNNTGGIIRTLTNGSQVNHPGGSQKTMIGYSLLEHQVYHQAVPISPDFAPFTDYIGILNHVNICDWVDNKGVSQIWIWSYHNAQVVPHESDMSMGRISRHMWNNGDKHNVIPSATFGDISNDPYQSNDLIQCEKTYVVYNYTVPSGVGNPVHNHLHQIENVLGFADRQTFWYQFGGKQYEQEPGPWKCGNAHFTPSSELGRDYQYDSPLTVPDLCTSWYLPSQSPSSSSTISCRVWGCHDVGFYTWWMQRLSNTDCTTMVQSPALATTYYRNWWGAIANFDSYFANNTRYSLSTRPANQQGKSLYTDRCGTTPTPTADLVRNGDFLEGANGWSFHTSNHANTMEVRDGIVILTTQETLTGDVWLYQPGLTLRKKQKYRLSIKLKASHGGRDNLRIVNHRGHQEKRLPIRYSEEWRVYTDTFNADEDSSNVVIKLVLNGYGSLRTIYVDSVSLVPVENNVP